MPTCELYNQPSAPTRLLFGVHNYYDLRPCHSAALTSGAAALPNNTDNGMRAGSRKLQYLLSESGLRSVPAHNREDNGGLGLFGSVEKLKTLPRECL